MSLKLYYHPFASFCQKVLIALYEKDIPFERLLVDLGDEGSSTAFKVVWPIGKFPVLRDEAADRTIPETSIIIEYLDRQYPDGPRLIGADPEIALETRLWDRFYDQYVSVPLTKLVIDHIRPAGARDSQGVAEAGALLQTAYGVADERMRNREWAAGDWFGMADCAAAPALFYAELVLPFTETHTHLSGYFDRLMRRPSFARAVEEAKPYRHLFPVPGAAWERVASR